MENTIVNEVVQNKDVTPAIEQAAKNSVNGGVIALCGLGIAGIGYLAYKGVEKVKEIRATKKKAEEEAAKEHQFFVPNP